MTGSIRAKCRYTSPLLERSLAWGATRQFNRREGGQGSLVRIAVSAIDGRRRRLEFKPREEGFVLRVIGHAVHLYCIGSVGETFDDIAILQIVLAIAVRGQPPGGDVVLAIAGYERIIESFRDLVGESSDVDEGAAEQSGTDPRRIVHDITSLPVAIARVARFKVVGVKSEDTAVFGIAVEVKVGVGEQKSGNVFGGDIAGILGGADGRGGIGRDRREKQVDELIDIDEHKPTTGTIGLEAVEVEA